MKRSVLYILVLVLFSGCSLLKKITEEPEFAVDKQALEQAVNKAVDELLSSEWLSDFMSENNERPIIMTSLITNNSNGIVNVNTIYETIDMYLVKSGQVRVVKTDDAQRILSPYELAKGESVDYVISSIIEDNPNKDSSVIFKISLWNDQTREPVTEIKNVVE